MRYSRYHSHQLIESSIPHELDYVMFLGDLTYVLIYGRRLPVWRNIIYSMADSVLEQCATNVEAE